MPKITEVAEESIWGGLFLFTGNLSSLLILAIGSIIVARLLGPENYGIYSLSLIIPSIILGFLDLGINSALTRFSAKLRAEGKQHLVACMLKAGFAFKLAMSTAAFLVCFFLSDFLAYLLLRRPEMGFFVKLASPLILFQTLYTTLSSSFIGLDMMKDNAVVMNIQAVVKTVLCPLFIVFFGVAGAVAGHVSSYALAGLLGFLSLFKIYRNGQSCSGFSSLKMMLGYGFPLYLSAVLSYIISQYQTLVLAFFASNTEIGNFTAAMTLSTAISALTFPLVVLFPAFSKLENSDLRMFFRLSVKYTALLIVPASTALAVLSKDIIYLIYGRSYSLAPSFLSLYALTFLYAGIGSAVLSYFFNGTGETGVVFKSNLINLIVFLPLASALTMLYRVPGLIIALLVSGIFPLFYGLFVAKKKFQAEIDALASIKIYAASFISAIVALAFTIFLRNSLINVVFCGLIFVLAYLTLLSLIGGISAYDLENFELMFRNKSLWFIIKPIIKYEKKLLAKVETRGKQKY